MSITVAIADDQPLVRAGLRMIIDAAEGLRLIAEATNGKVSKPPGSWPGPAGRGS